MSKTTVSEIHAAAHASTRSVVASLTGTAFQASHVVTTFCEGGSITVGSAAIRSGTLDGSTPAEANRWKKIGRKLRQYAKLKPGWDSYRAQPPSSVALANAYFLLDRLRKDDLLPERVDPSVNGGIGMTFRKNKDRDVYVECDNLGGIYALYADDADENAEPFAEQYASVQAAVKKLRLSVPEYLDA